MKRAIFECWTDLMFCWIGLIFCFIMAYSFGSLLKDSIQTLSKLFIFLCPSHIFFLVFHTTDSYYLTSILFIFILLVLCIPDLSSSGCGFVNLFMIKHKLKVIQ